MKKLVLLFPLLLVGCGPGMMGASSGTEVWQFTATTAAGLSSATLSCSGAGVCSGGSWVLATTDVAGCVLNVTFTATFEGKNVSLSDFARGGSSTCTGPSLPRGDAKGSGITDVPFPNAASARGTATIPFVGVLYVITGPPAIPWQARRLS
jgi:hypothetical protein